MTADQPKAGAKTSFSPELALLERRQREEAPAPDAPVRRETSRVRIPEGGKLPRSEALLERLYHGELVPREKKPQVVDTRRSWGPYLVSMDDPAMVLLDACSQIATLTEGFAHSGMLQGLHEGRFDECLWANPDVTVEPSPTLEAFAELLTSKAPKGLEHVAFGGAGGAEANEKAFRIARMQAGPGKDGKARTRVLAFEGSFHGRTFVSLSATYNPAKRLGVTMPGFEAVFCPRDLDALDGILDEHGDELYAAIIEPMMAEGGDVHLTREFLLGVLDKTRARGIPLIVDEVQTGFGTGGTFFWWTRLGLGDTPETSPALLTCAKKAGLSVILSRWPDPEPTAVNVASALRAMIQAESAEDQGALEGPISERLQTLAATHPELVSNPRVAGTAFAFDLPSVAARDAFIGQRFARGFMTYHAGEKTIRFRLASCWTEGNLDDLFARVSTALNRLEDPSAREFRTERSRRRPRLPHVIREVREGDWAEIMALEQQTYEPARADSEAYLRKTAHHGVGLVARDGRTDALLGFAFAASLEHYGHLDGPKDDPWRGTGRVLYSADICVAEAARGRGMGRALKVAQIEWARAHDFAFITGRNRVGATDEMAALNRSVGAYTVTVYDGQYDGGQAEYYRIPLAPPCPPKKHRRVYDLASGIQAPFGPRPEFMASRELVGPTASRLNLSNWATLDMVHYLEHLRAILPRGTGHLYTTTSQDELVDKTLRCLKMSRDTPEQPATVCVGFEGGFVGHNTAAARSLSDPEGFAAGLGVYDWPRLPHPEAAGVEATVAALEAQVERLGAGAIIGVFVELVGQRSGRVLSGEAALALQGACRKHGIPLVVVETATGGYRSGAGAWGLDALPKAFTPNVVLWYPGGQLGQIFIDSTWWVGTPLRLISTWDGDELSMIRTHEHLRAAHRLDLEPAIVALDDLAVEAAAAAGEGARMGGVGLYRTLSLGGDAERARAVVERCREAGLRVGRGLPDTLVFAPALDVRPSAIRGPMRAALLGALAAPAESGDA
ncbi:L-lysine aminotransferase [Plesiocystis pacifica SIR-1]|uniref:L-lysine aminotransferase n=1 Tax=Plesiocystis pacifica SIR-1 TaxID=391625 RepID=A6FWZ9_9BACT|nr:aminotransferase class III-fold pyridoxal phosphate-dependent enzyme [Plesiocystis pacifica]EDM81823.1 L-lysine aminotransferase [Plesiocystis pacifica SIR-1]